MYDKTPYTPGMREILKLSKAEAGRLGHDYIGPEHYLLGIIRKGDGLAVQTLSNLELDLEDLKMELERMLDVGKGPNVNLFAPNAEAKKVLDATKEVARQMKHNWIGSEHLLLGLIREENTIAAKCLRNFSVDFGKAHKEVLNVIDGSNSGRTVSRGKDARAAPEGLPFTPHLRTVAQAARIDAEQHDYAEPALEHYLIAIVRARQGVAWEALQLCGAKPAQIIAELEHRLQSARDADPKSLHAPGEARQILAQARAIAAEKKHRWLGTEHLLLAILSETTNYPGKCLRSLGLDLESVSPVVTRLLNNCPSSLSPNRLPDALQKGLRSAGALEGLMDSGVSGSVELGRLVSNLRGALDLLWVCLQECVYVEVRIDGDAAIAAEVLAVDPNAVVTEMKAGTVELLYKGLPEDLEPVLRKLVGAAPIFSFSVDKITPENTSEAVARLLDMKR